jgi:hypothetical protein
MGTSIEQTTDAHGLLTAATSAWRRVRRALQDRTRSAGLDRTCLRTEVDHLISTGARIMGNEVAAFGQYQMPEWTLCPSANKTASQLELRSTLDCLERFACYLKSRISQGARPDVCVNDGGPH